MSAAFLTLPALYAEQRLRNGTVSVRLSVWAYGSKPVAAGLWARPARDIDRLLHRRRANAGSATLSAYVCS